MKIAEALRLLRNRRGLTQTAASRNEGAPDFRTVSRWENGRKQPSMALLLPYLRSLGFNLGDLQAALDQVEGRLPTELEEGFGKLEQRVGALERHVGLSEVEALEAESPR